MDGLSLYKILNYYHDFLLNAKINRCTFDDFGFTISLYNQKKKSLIFDSRMKYYLFFKESGEKRKNVLSHLSSSKIVEIKQRGFDRLFYLKCLKRKPSGKLVEYKLIFETVGKLSNLFLLEGEKIIFRWNGNNIDSDRDISLGKNYIPFKSNKIENLYNTDCGSFENLEGFYKVTAFHADKLFAQLKDCKETVGKILRSLTDDAYFYVDEKNRLIPFEILNYKNKVHIEELGNFLSRGFANGKKEDSYYLRLKKILEKKIRKNEQILQKLNEDLKIAKNYRDILMKAELLKDNIHLLKNNSAKKVILYKYEKDGVKEIEYEKDFDEPIEKHIEKLFKKGNKLKRSLEKIEKRIEEVSAMLSFYKDELFNLDNLKEEEIKDLYMMYNSTANNEYKKQPEKEPFIKINRGDATLFVGKNSKGNQHIVFKIAKPDDLWFHAHNIPSAHVILKKNGAIEDDDIMFAARVTAYFSKYKKEKKVPIDYTLRKYVRKPKNTPDGFVIYKNYKTIIVTPFTDEDMEKLKK